MTTAQALAALTAQVADLRAEVAAARVATPKASSVAATVKPEFPLAATHACEVDDACKFMARTAPRAKIHGPEGHNFTSVNRKAKRSRKAR